MNNRGLTIVELITTFALSSVIIILLLNVIVVIRNLYTKANVKTELYINQANLSNELNKKINHNNLIGYEICSDGTFCYNFSFSDGSSTKLIVEERKIEFGDFVYKLDNSTKVENPSLEVGYIDQNSNNNILVLKIPIVSNIYPTINFGINLVYLYNIN